jgi:3-hydroxyisobutyrate dehydrogenase
MNVTVLGMGTMGRPIAANLLRADYPTTVWDRTPAKAAPLVRLGAAVAATATAAVANTDVLITMLPDANAVVSVVDHQGVLTALPRGAVWAQMGTIGLGGIDRLAAMVKEQRPDVMFVDAPVSGSKGPAEHGELLVLASGPPEAEPIMAPIFDALGQRTIWLGDTGRGTRLKLVLNTWLAFLIEGVAETAALSDELAITHAELLDALDAGPLAAPAAVAKLNKVDSGDYEPDFALNWALKDVELAMAAVPARLPVLSAIAEHWHTAVADGLGRLDVSAARLALKEPHGRRRSA